MTVDVALRSEAPFTVRNNLVRAEFRPELRLLGTGEVLFLRGPVYVDPSTLALPSGRLQIESGTIEFRRDSPFVPVLQLTAEMRARDAWIVLLLAFAPAATAQHGLPPPARPLHARMAEADVVALGTVERVEMGRIEVTDAAVVSGEPGERLMRKRSPSREPALRRRRCAFARRTRLPASPSTIQSSSFGSSWRALSKTPAPTRVSIRREMSRREMSKGREQVTCSAAGYSWSAPRRRGSFERRPSGRSTRNSARDRRARRTRGASTPTARPNRRASGRRRAGLGPF